MAFDAAMLDAVAEDGSSALLRTYAWAVPTLSLGYFQAIAEAEADPRWRGVPIVRRPTGGGALWHDRELTYALVIPRAHPLARRATDLYRVVHGAIVEVLREEGVPAGRRGGRGGGAARPFLCFADRDPEDVVARGAKVVGSAQRRRAGAVLQHGSILLAGSPRTHELPGIAEVCGIALDRARLAGRLRAAIPAAVGGPTREPGSAVGIRAEALGRRLYGDPAWTRRR